MWLTLLVMIIFWFIHVAANDIISLFFMSEKYFYIYMCVCVYVFIHSSVNGHIGCFHVLVILSNAAMIIGMHVSFQIFYGNLFILERE